MEHCQGSRPGESGESLAAAFAAVEVAPISCVDLSFLDWRPR